MPAFADRPVAAAWPEPWESPSFRDVETSPPGLDAAAAKVQATAKIAAQANATAQALDSLQRRLNRTVASAAPHAQPAYPPAQPQHPHTAPFHLRQDDPFVHEMAAMLPLPVPPSERSGKSVYLLGFLTGLVLSVMAGAALYFLINTG
jgi:hypothetical protein